MFQYNFLIVHSRSYCDFIETNKTIRLLQMHGIEITPCIRYNSLTRIHLIINPPTEISAGHALPEKQGKTHGSPSSSLARVTQTYIARPGLWRASLIAVGYTPRRRLTRSKFQRPPERDIQPRLRSLKYR